MDGLPFATSLARSLLALARAKATGVLRVDARERARIALVDGCPCAIWTSTDPAESLGDILCREGTLDHAAHGRALSAGPPDVPVGQWLVATGAATRAHVDRALRQQLERRLSSILSWEAAHLGFEAGRADVGVPSVAEPASAADLVLGVMREAVAPMPLREIRRRLGEAPLELTTFGEALVAAATLGPQDRALLAPLRARASVEIVLGAAAWSSHATRTLYAMRLLAAVRPLAVDLGSYSVLLRKQRQLRSRASAQSLLDLPATARPDQARRALRRLARHVHPDRFSAHDPEEVRRASEEVMSALVRAERVVREPR